ncbi:hypothetical protein GW17_00061790 [Ensete ventricosum]|nr:hypothetical protein GW17_00061790 [Ensete ventricosum]
MHPLRFSNSGIKAKLARRRGGRPPTARPAARSTARYQRPAGKGLLARDEVAVAAVDEQGQRQRREAQRERGGDSWRLRRMVMRRSDGTDDDEINNHKA